MRVATLTDVGDRLSAYIDESRHSPIVITRDGRPVAMLIAVKDEDGFDGLLPAHNSCLLELLDEARQRVSVTGGIPLREFRCRLDASASG